MIGTPSSSISRTRLWTGRGIAAWLVLFLAFDAIVKVLNLSVAALLLGRRVEELE